MVFVNKMDRTGANFFRVVDQIRERLQGNAFPIQIPIGAEDNFTGLVDIIEQKAHVYTNDIGTDIKIEDVPEDLKQITAEKREALIEAVAECDDNLMMKYLEGEEISADEIRLALRKATCENKVIPVLCGTAFKNKGVQLLLDAVIDYMPSPVDVEAIKGELPDGTHSERKNDDNEPFAALAFKIMTDPYVGRLTFIRVYSGVLKSGSYVLNSTTGNKRTYQPYRSMNADQRNEVSEIYAGDICAVVGLKGTTTGDLFAMKLNRLFLIN
jgi:elongation factor G